MNITKILSLRSIQWSILNIIGIGIYLWLASSLWVPAEQFGQPGGPGDGIFFVVILMPYLLAFALLNLTVLGLILRRAYRAGLSQCELCSWCAVMALWVAALAIDKLMAFNIVDMG